VPIFVLTLARPDLLAPTVNQETRVPMDNQAMVVEPRSPARPVPRDLPARPASPVNLDSPEAQAILLRLKTAALAHLDPLAAPAHLARPVLLVNPDSPVAQERPARKDLPDNPDSPETMDSPEPPETLEHLVDQARRASAPSTAPSTVVCSSRTAPGDVRGTPSPVDETPVPISTFPGHFSLVLVKTAILYVLLDKPRRIP